LGTELRGEVFIDSLKVLEQYTCRVTFPERNQNSTLI
jgi:hypothetical protein